MSKKNEIPTLEKINLENIFQNFLNLLNNEIKDLRSLEIITVSAENLLIEIEKHDNNNTTERISLLKDLELFKDEQKVKVLARTHYELDGDIIQFLPIIKNQENTNSKELKENTAEIMTIHNQNVERALKNQQDFIKIMTGFVSQVLVGLTGTNGLKGLGNLMDIFVTAKNKT
jgi:hypothetical protein